MCCLWWSVWQRDAVRKSNPQKMTLARQRVLSSSEIRASDLEHGGSWVRIPSGAQIFSVSSYGWFFTSPFISFIKKTIGKFKTSQQRNNNKTTGLDWGRDFSLKSRIMRYHLLFWARSFTLQASRIPCLPSAFANELLAINRSHLLPAFVVERTLNSISRHQCETLSFRN